MVMDLNQHVPNDDAGRPFHSSGIAKIASGDRVGATANESFQQRKEVEENRKYIQAYRASFLGNTYNADRPKPISRESFHKVGLPQRPTGSPSVRKLITPARTIGFKEPRGRNYDPFA